jgi:hypothetical protein
MTKDKLITAGVVFAGILALAAANRLGVDKDLLTAGGALLIAIAGSLRSMVLPEKKVDP